MHFHKKHSSDHMQVCSRKSLVFKSETQTSFFSPFPLPLRLLPGIFSSALGPLIGATCVQSDLNILPDVTFVSKLFQTETPSDFKWNCTTQTIFNFKNIPEDSAISMIKHNMKNMKLHLHSELGHLILIFFSFLLFCTLKIAKILGMWS